MNDKYSDFYFNLIKSYLTAFKKTKNKSGAEKVALIYIANQEENFHHLYVQTKNLSRKIRNTDKKDVNKFFNEDTFDLDLEDYQLKNIAGSDYFHLLIKIYFDLKMKGYTNEESISAINVNELSGLYSDLEPWTKNQIMSYLDFERLDKYINSWSSENIVNSVLNTFDTAKLDVFRSFLETIKEDSCLKKEPKKNRFTYYLLASFSPFSKNNIEYLLYEPSACDKLIEEIDYIKKLRTDALLEEGSQKVR